MDGFLTTALSKIALLVPHKIYHALAMEQHLNHWHGADHTGSIHHLGGAAHPDGQLEGVHSDPFGLPTSHGFNLPSGHAFSLPEVDGTHLTSVGHAAIAKGGLMVGFADHHALGGNVVETASQTALGNGLAVEDVSPDQQHAWAVYTNTENYAIGFRPVWNGESISDHSLSQFGVASDPTMHALQLASGGEIVLGPHKTVLVTFDVGFPKVKPSFSATFVHPLNGTAPSTYDRGLANPPIMQAGATPNVGLSPASDSKVLDALQDRSLTLTPDEADVLAKIIKNDTMWGHLIRSQPALDGLNAALDGMTKGTPIQLFFKWNSHFFQGLAVASKAIAHSISVARECEWLMGPILDNSRNAAFFEELRDILCCEC